MFLKNHQPQPSKTPSSNKAGGVITADKPVKEVIPPKFISYGKVDVPTFLASLELEAPLIENDKILKETLSSIATKIGFKGQGAVKIATALTQMVKEGKLTKKPASAIDGWAYDMVERLKGIKSGSRKIVPLKPEPKPETVVRADENGILFGGYDGIIKEVNPDHIIIDFPYMDSDVTVRIETYVTSPQGKVIHADVNRLLDGSNSKRNRTDPADFKIGQRIHFIYDSDGSCHSPTISGGKNKRGEVQSKNSTTMGILSFSGKTKTAVSAAPEVQPDAKPAPAAKTAPATKTTPAPVEDDGFGVTPAAPSVPNVPAKTAEEIANDALVALAAENDLTPQILRGDKMLNGLIKSETPGDVNAALSAAFKKPVQVTHYLEITIPAGGMKEGEKISAFLWQDAETAAE